MDRFVYMPDQWDQIRNTMLIPREGRKTSVENVLIEHIYDTARTGADNGDPALFQFCSADLQQVVIRDIHTAPGRRLAVFSEKTRPKVFGFFPDLYHRGILV